MNTLRLSSPDMNTLNKVIKHAESPDNTLNLTAGDRFGWYHLDTSGIISPGDGIGDSEIGPLNVTNSLLGRYVPGRAGINTGAAESVLFLLQAESAPQQPAPQAPKPSLFARILNRETQPKTSELPATQPKLYMGARAITWQYQLRTEGEVSGWPLLDGEQHEGEFNRGLLPLHYSPMVTIGNLGPNGPDYLELTREKPAVARILAQHVTDVLVERMRQNPDNKHNNRQTPQSNYPTLPKGWGMRLLVVDNADPKRFANAEKRVLTVGNTHKLSQ